MSLPVPVKRALAWGLLRSGLLAVAEAARPGRRAILLMYHRVTPGQDPFFPSLAREEFERQLDYVAGRYRMGTLGEVMTWLEGGPRGGTRVALTFDDGYADTYEVVLPLLQSRALRATIFVNTLPPETGQPLWVDRLRSFFRDATATELDYPAGGLERVSLAAVEERLAAARRVARWLETQRPQRIEDAVGELELKLAPAANGHPPSILTWPQLEAMQAGGFEVGAHTHRHYVLSRLTPEEARQEILTSVELIQRRLGGPVSSFAYPKGTPGDYGPSLKPVLREADIHWACSARDGFAGPGEDPLDLPRLHIRAHSLALFACRLAGVTA